MVSNLLMTKLLMTKPLMNKTSRCLTLNLRHEHQMRKVSMQTLLFSQAHPSTVQSQSRGKICRNTCENIG